jgi:hypothetical protein
MTMARYHDWVRRLTLKQFILFIGVVNFAAASAVDVVFFSAFAKSFSWGGVAVWTVLMTAYYAWRRRGRLPWVRRLTLKQFILFIGVVNFAAASAVDVVFFSAFAKPFSWGGVAVWTVLMTAYYAWRRRGRLPQGNEYPTGQDDDSTSS